MNTTTVQRLIGVYNAEGTLRGELSYWIGARFGVAHCSLCEITHGTFRVKSDWKECRAGLGVPFDMFHLDDQPDSVRPFTLAAGAPIVAAETAQGVVVLLGPEALESFDGSVDRMIAAVEERLEELGLDWG